jgi:thymidylate kinase
MNKQRVILMEGADGVGKTEIGRYLANLYGIPYFRMPSQHENWRKGQFKTALEFDQTYLAEFLMQTNHSVVVDRAWPSEWVYSQVYARDTNWELLEALDSLWMSMEAWIIIPLRRSFERAREDEVVTKSKLPLIQQKYLEFAEWTECNVITFYVDDPVINCSIAEESKLIVPHLDESTNIANVKVHYGRHR